MPFSNLLLTPDFNAVLTGDELLRGLKITQFSWLTHKLPVTSVLVPTGHDVHKIKETVLMNKTKTSSH